MLQGPLATLPWYHHIALLEKLSDPETRLWYAAAAVDHGWSRNVLAHHIEAKLHERSGKAITNFAATMPSPDSDLAQQSFKDPYIFDFLAMTDLRNERGLENQPILHVERFLLELGQGFAFVGRQVRLTTGADEFFADLLFYNFKLRCFVVVELKATAFKPGYLGQINMYRRFGEPGGINVKAPVKLSPRKTGRVAATHDTDVLSGHRRRLGDCFPVKTPLPNKASS